MRMVVCFKIVADFEDVIPTDWDHMEALDFSYVKKIYGCYDEAALETALRLKDELVAAGENVRSVAVTVGGGPGVLFTGLYAAGFDDVVRIEGSDSEFAPGRTAAMLIGFLKEEQPELVFTGQTVGACDSGMVPALVAAGLGYGWLDAVTEVHFNPQEKQVEAVCEEKNFLVNRALMAPAVLTVGNGTASALRMFSLKARMAANKKTVRLWTAEDFADDTTASAAPGAIPAPGAVPGPGAVSVTPGPAGALGTISVTPALAPGAVSAASGPAGALGTVSVTPGPGAVLDYMADGFYNEIKAGSCQWILGDDAPAKAKLLLERIKEVARK